MKAKGDAATDMFMPTRMKLASVKRKRKGTITIYKNIKIKSIFSSCIAREFCKRKNNKQTNKQRKKKPKTNRLIQGTLTMIYHIVYTICSHIYRSLHKRLIIVNIFSTDNGGKETRYGRNMKTFKFSSIEIN